MPRRKELAEALEIIEAPVETEDSLQQMPVSQQHHPVELRLHGYRGSQQAAGVSPRHAAKSYARRRGIPASPFKRASAKTARSAAYPG